MEKKYRDEYADHCIRHPKNHVSYITFRWRMKKWWPKLAIRLWKDQSAVKMWEIIKERIEAHKQEKKSRNTIKTIATILAGIVLFWLWVLTWILM